ncbi:hypothetical protein A3Q56_04690, partial [Intoshia linei]
MGLINFAIRNLSNGIKNCQYIVCKTVGKENNVGLIQFNRPKQLNALCDGLVKEVAESLKLYNCDNKIGCIVITGNEKAFSAGADITEMQSKKFSHTYNERFLLDFQRMFHIDKPIIAAVSGYALGGGCELAMSCDIIYASNCAKFSQPEIKIGTIPG